ncbi:CCA tRNA nucleotidyltransferase [Clostridium sp. SM-530-WT-3G]|uniref:CCA tRNA nucleotidyltransferase n=1 Tax=Clostridium sp. SM-530-WT-3G TaxID=2725303 RepID=UPI00145D270A|nr:CCA tRNA nucleotidyltransferase [Clostridium sp. SM-530-WT-3G]
MDLNIKLPEEVKFIIKILIENGYEAYIVGGCVRDSIIGRNINDWDMTTSAEPEKVVELFDKVILTGIKHGTVTVVINNNHYEITTFRSDGEYDDNRHPIKVEFVKTLREDLARRDFTINAIAYNEEYGIQDYFYGISDLNNKIIRTVGDPVLRFNEDALRMLRAVRFSAQLGFTIDENTFESIKKVSSNIVYISKERVRDELNKIILSDNTKFVDLKNSKLLDYLIPELNYINSDKLLQLNNMKNDIILRLAVLLMNLGEDVAEDVLKRFRYDNNTIRNVILLIKYKDFDLDSTINIKRMLNIIGEDLIYGLVDIKKAQIILSSDKIKSNKLNSIDKSLSDIKDIINSGQCYSLKQMNINGRDLIELGYKKGKNIGEVLNHLLNLVMENSKLNDKEVLIRIAEEIKDK